MFNLLKKIDKELFYLVSAELQRQKETIDLIASENIVPSVILEVLGSALTNKYSEGYPFKRYYPGNFYYDEIEILAQKRALKAFNLNEKNWAVNVQPYSGSPANLAVYNALLNPFDILMGMNLTSGGHLTHGHSVNLSGKIYKAIQYGINEKTQLIDYNQVEKLAKKFKPKLIVCGTTSYPRIINFKKFKEIADKVNAFLMADISHIAGLVLAGCHPNPFKYCDIVTTTTHKTLRGPRGAVIFINKKSKIATKQKIDLESLINKSVFPGMQGGPHNNVTASIALMFKLAKTEKFKNYQKQIVKNAKTLANELKKYGFNLVSNGTDNHLMVVDVKNTGFSGIEAEKILEKANILVNRNVISGDLKPFKPSGIRIGTPAVTSRKMKEKEMKIIAQWISHLLFKKEKPEVIKKEVIKLLKKFPLYEK
ncbi:MAG: serine hydroxymethyltransferase [Minisyncoccia bacterium]